MRNTFILSTQPPKALRLPVSPVKTWMTRYCLEEISAPLSAPFLNFPRRAHSPSIISISILSTSLRNNDFSVEKKVKEILAPMWYGPKFPKLRSLFLKKHAREARISKPEQQESLCRCFQLPALLLHCPLSLTENRGRMPQSPHMDVSQSCCPSSCS